MTIFNKTDGVLDAQVDEQRIVLAPSTLTYFTLSGAGPAIWDLLATPGQDVDSLVTALLAEFEVDEATCRTEVEAFLAAATEAGVIVAESKPN